MNKIKKNYKIIVCLMLIKDYDINLVFNTINYIFSMEYPQITYFINKLIDQDLVKKQIDSFQYSLTENGKNYLREFNLLDIRLEELNKTTPKINDDFYLSYLKK